jgi:hypothetical protein
VYTQTSTLTFNAAGDAYITNNSPDKGLSSAALDVSGTASGTAQIINYGATVVPTNTTFNGTTAVTLTANSPLTINGTLTSMGQVILTAANPGDLAIGGSVSGGSVFLNAPGGSVSGNIPLNAVITQASTNLTGATGAEQAVADTLEKTSAQEAEEITARSDQVDSIPLTFLDDDPEVVLYTLMQLDTAVREEEEEITQESATKNSSATSGSESILERKVDERRKPDYCPC